VSGSSRAGRPDAFRIAFAVALIVLGGALRAQNKATPLPKEAEERVKEFQRHVASDEPRVRAEQMERLATVDFPEAVRLLQNHGLKDSEYSVRERATWALSQMKSETSRAAVLAGFKDGNESVRAGTAVAVAKMNPRPASAVADIVALLSDQREEVQIAACEALGMVASKDAAGPLAAVATSPKERVGVAAADALSLIKDPASASTLIAMLSGGTWRTQGAAINALSQLRVREAIEPLIAYLKDSQGRPREDARAALQHITTNDFGMNAARWEEWWKGVQSDWKVPPLPSKKGPEVVEKGDRYGRVERGYHQMKITSHRLLFVIDVSSSMLDPIRVKRGRTDSEDKVTKASPKLDLAREELARTLRTLDENTTFNVIAFESDIRFFKKEPISGTPGNIQEAILWVEKQKPRTINTGGARQSSGIDADGMLMGRTNTYGALKAAFGLPHRPRKKNEGGTTGGASTAPKPKIDTVYFLTDGEPTEGETTNIDEILQDVKQWNRSARVIINTIGMNAETGALKNLLIGLANVTGGQCIFVGE
jgi:HEAT repeat protein